MMPEQWTLLQTQCTHHRRISIGQVKLLSINARKFEAHRLVENSSREAHAKQKADKEERKAAKPNADLIRRSKQLWERLRRKSHVERTERKKLVIELFDIVTGRVKDFVFKHDSVRVIQTALKYANIDQRKMIAKELKGEYKVLAESKYAKFLIGKILVHGDVEVRDLVVPEFYGHVRRLIRHPEAAWILDDVYRGIATPSQKILLLREWYGAEFAIFRAEKSKGVSIPGDLKTLLEECPEKKVPMMRALHEIINILVQKKTTGFTMLHDAMLQYFLNVQVGSQEANEFIELLKGDEEGDLLKNLAFTKSGARLVCLAFAYSSAKDRKIMLRVYKGNMQTLAYDVNGHQVFLAVYDVIDDTVLTSKSVFPELLGKEGSDTYHQNLLATVADLNARVPLLYLFCGKSKAVLHNEDLKILDEIHRIRASTSKKNPDSRRKELLAALSPPVLDCIASQARALIETSFGCQFIAEVLCSAVGDRNAAVTAVANLTNGDEETQELLAQPHAGRMLKSLVLGGRFNPSKKIVEPVDPPLGFHNIFYDNVKDVLISWATGANSFVVVGLLEAAGFSKADELKATLGKNKAELVKAAKQTGYESVEKKRKRAQEGNCRTQQNTLCKGNAGALMLLQKLDQ